MSEDSPHPYQVCLATSQHLEALVGLESRLQGDASQFSLFDEFAHEMSRIWLVGSESEWVGYVLVRAIASEAEILHIEVDQRFRKRGLGTLLLAKLLRECEVDTVNLEVRVSNNGAQALYRKLGFVVTGCRKGYYSRPKEDAVLMQWNRIQG